MSHSRNFRVYFLLAILLIAGLVVLLREHRPSFLRPGLHLNAYVSTADGSVTVVDLAGLRVAGKIDIGPGISDIRENPKRDEIWGTSSTGGYVWVIDAPSWRVRRVPVGPLPYSLDFSVDGKRAYTTSAGSDQLIALDGDTHAIASKGKTGSEPVQARVTADGKTVVVVNRRGSTVSIHDAATLAMRANVPVLGHPDEVALTQDGATAFVISREDSRMSVVDVRKGVLLANLKLAGEPSQMILRPDGGEVYVISPEAHGLEAISTWTHEVGDYLLLGSAPTYGILTADGSEMYVSDPDSGRIMPLDVQNRRLGKPVTVGARPGAMRFDPTEEGAKPTMLLVVDEGSGDLAVLKTRTDSLLTLIPVGNKPERIAVKLF